MKKHLLLFICFSIAVSAFGQVVLNPESLTTVLNPEDTEELVLDIEVVNNNGNIEDVFWNLGNTDGLPSAWAFYLCDSKICYPEGTTKSSNN